MSLVSKSCKSQNDYALLLSCFRHYYLVASMNFSASNLVFSIYCIQDFLDFAYRNGTCKELQMTGISRPFRFCLLTVYAAGKQYLR